MGKKQKNGAELFDQFYLDMFKNRWVELKTSLLQPTNPIAYNEGLRAPYFLDEASILCAQALKVKKGERVLDMCSAPGGKALVLLSILKDSGEIILNEKSPQRFHRLIRNIRDHFGEVSLSHLRFTNFNGMVFGKNPEEFDKILLDAPCSSERHIIHSLKHLSAWTAGRSKTLSVTQIGLLCAAHDALKPGGRLIYSTCALSSKENDGVIQKLLKKRPTAVVLEPELKKGEETDYGIIILPDRNQGMGPLYISALGKIS